MLKDGQESPHKFVKNKARDSLHSLGTIHYRAQVCYIFCLLHSHQTHFSPDESWQNPLNVVHFGAQYEGWCGPRYCGSWERKRPEGALRIMKTGTSPSRSLYLRVQGHTGVVFCLLNLAKVK